MPGLSTDALDRPTTMPAPRATANLTTLSTFEMLIATGALCLAIWVLIGLTVFGTR